MIEATDHDAARRVTEAVAAPTIGIAAGAATDGQVLVVSDLIGLTPEPPPFVTPLANVFADIVRAGEEWAAQVRD